MITEIKKHLPFFNSFDNTSNHVIIAPIVSIIMGALGGGIALIILSIKTRKQAVT